MKEAKRQEAIAAREAREAKAAMKAANEMKATILPHQRRTCLHFPLERTVAVWRMSLQLR